MLRGTRLIVVGRVGNAGFGVVVVVGAAAVVRLPLLSAVAAVAWL